MLDRDEIRELLCETWFYFGDILPALTGSSEGKIERTKRCFTEDAVFEYPGGVKLHGHEELAMFGQVVRKHWSHADGTYYEYDPNETPTEPNTSRQARFLGPLYIELDGDKARAWVTWSQVSWRSKHSDPMKPDQYSWGALHYNELVRTPEGWRIKYRRNIGMRPQDPDAEPERNRPIRVATAAAEAKALVEAARAAKGN
jgi:SnoaL-like protein